MRILEHRRDKHHYAAATFRNSRHPPSPHTEPIPLRLCWRTAGAIATAQPHTPKPNRHGKPPSPSPIPLWRLQKEPVSYPNLATPSAAAPSSKPGIRTPRRRVASGAIGVEGAGRREEKRSLTSPGDAAHPLRSSGDRTAPPPRSGRRRGAPKSRIAQAKGEAFSTQFLIGKKWSCAPCFSGLCFASLGMFQISDAANGRGTNGSSGQSELTQVAIGPDGRTPTTERLSEHASPVRLFPSV